MTIEQAKAFIAKYPNAISFVRPSHLEEMSPLYEVHIEAVEVTRDDFHSLTGGVLYPRKETTDRFGSAAGISFADTKVSTRKDDGVFIGRAVPQEMGPDGKMIVWNAAEYEFDPAVRAEIDILTAEKKGNKKTDIEKKLVKLNYQKVGRRRADTGARAAAIISAINMSTGFKAGELFGSAKQVTFLFSRVIVNSKNELVLNKALESMFDTAGSLYGPQAVAQITGEVGDPETVQAATGGMKNVTPGEASDDDFPGGGDDIPVLGEEKKFVWDALVEYENAYELPPGAQAHINEYRGDLPGADLDKMKELLDWIKGWEERHHGAAS